MANLYSDLVTEFQNIKNQLIGLNDFYVGDSQRIIGATLSKINYPALWLENPLIETKAVYDSYGNIESWHTEFDIAFLVLQNTATDDIAAQDTAMNDTLNLTQHIIRRFINHPTYKEAQGFVTEPLVSQLVDNLYGWRTTFTCRITFDSCCQQAAWSVTVNC
jgi:hypothetical protein